MSEKLSLKQGLKVFYADKSLSANQLEKLQKPFTPQLKQALSTDEASRAEPDVAAQLASKKWFMSLLASIALSVTALYYLVTPSIITAAYVDISKDADINNGIKLSMQQWLDENGVAAIPRQYPVEMSRFCKLDQYLTTHLRIAGREQGVLHLFFHQGKRPMYWLGQQGVKKNMHWRLMNVGDDLTLIVMYTEDMRESAVEHILAEILPSLQA